MAPVQAVSVYINVRKQIDIFIYIIKEIYITLFFIKSSHSGTPNTNEAGYGHTFNITKNYSVEISEILLF